MKNDTGKTLCLVCFLIGATILSALTLTFMFGIGVVTSGSMEPALKRNDLVLIRRARDFYTGDVAVYESDGQMIVHRIISMDGEKVITKGDANNAADAAIDKKDIVGIVVGKIACLPVTIEGGLHARYVSSASGSSRAEVARWDVSALTDTPDTLQITSGTEDYDENGYDFTVQSYSETTAEYHISIKVSSSDNDSDAGCITIGLFQYDPDVKTWLMAAESNTGSLEYDGVLPINGTSDRFRLKAKSIDAEAAGCFRADIDVDIVQVD